MLEEKKFELINTKVQEKLSDIAKSGHNKEELNEFIKKTFREARRGGAITLNDEELTEIVFEQVNIMIKKRKA